MSEKSIQEKPIKSDSHIFRVDKFVVPSTTRDAFIERVMATHEVLRKQPGFVRDYLLEQIAGPGEFNVVTVVEWASQAHIDKAKAAVMAMHKQSGFNPQETLARLGIKADIANYREIDA